MIAIIGLLASAAVYYRTRARDAMRMANLKKIQTALDLYYDENSFYPKHDGGTATIAMREDNGQSNYSMSEVLTLVSQKNLL